MSALRERRPLVLLLGQAAWETRDSVDPVLSLALTHLGRPNEVVKGWPLKLIFVGMLVASALGTPALAGPMDDFRARVTLRFINECMQGGRKPLSGTSLCTCWGTRLIASLTQDEMDAVISNTRLPATFRERDIASAEACVFEYLAGH